MIQYGTLLQYMFPDGADYSFLLIPETGVIVNTPGDNGVEVVYIPDYNNYDAIIWLDVIPKPTARECLDAWDAMLLEIANEEARIAARDLEIEAGRLANVTPVDPQTVTVQELGRRVAWLTNEIYKLTGVN